MEYGGSLQLVEVERHPVLDQGYRLIYGLVPGEVGAAGLVDNVIDRRVIKVDRFDAVEQVLKPIYLFLGRMVDLQWGKPKHIYLLPNIPSHDTFNHHIVV